MKMKTLTKQEISKLTWEETQAELDRIMKENKENPAQHNLCEAIAKKRAG